MPKKTKQPIFIHSLFRAGSTYLSNVFRESEAGYQCYQEPLHELAFFARNEPHLLEVDHGDSKVSVLRHPKMEVGYFKELIDSWPVWRDEINPLSIYHGYFAPDKWDIGISYWRSLIAASVDEPVFQECRTSGRIREIKASLHGRHIYLWRNPWDQWWSNKVDPYFDLVYQLIIRAPNPPDAVLSLREAIGIKDPLPNNLNTAFSVFDRRPPSSEHSYLIFYLLWCLGLREGMRHADLTINIDQLSDATAYRKKIKNALDKIGIGGMSFADCRVAQGYYSDSDRDFFLPLEDRVHHWLLAGGWSDEQLEWILATRQENAPRAWSKPLATFSASNWLEQTNRARVLSRRFESSVAELSEILRQTEHRAEIAETQVEEAKAQAEEAKAQAEEAKAQAEEAKAQAEKADALAMRAQQNERALRDQLLAMRESWSWRLTFPLRKTLDALRWIMRLPIRLLSALFGPILRRSMAFVLHRPRLRRFFSVVLQKVPFLYWGLFRAGQKADLPVTLEPWHDKDGQGHATQRGAHGSHPDLSTLSPHARRIYADLKAAIEANKAKNSQQ